MTSKKTVFALLLFVVFGHTTITSQADEGFEVHKTFDFRPTFSPIGFDFNLNDMFWSISGGIEEKNHEFGARINFEFRPFYKKIQLQSPNSNIIRQYHEKKYFFSIDVDKRFFNFDLWSAHTQLFIGSRNGILTGNYKGTKDDLDAKFLVAPMGGITLSFQENMLIRLGYIYFKDGLVNVPNHRVTIGFYAII